MSSHRVALLELLCCGCSKLWLPLHISAFQEAIRRGLNYFWKLGNVAKSQQEGNLHPAWLWEMDGQGQGSTGGLQGGWWLWGHSQEVTVTPHLAKCHCRGSEGWTP